MAARDPAPPEEAVSALLGLLARHVTLGASEQQVVREITRIERYPKGTLLLAQGGHAGECWLVVSGCVRVFRETRAESRTLALHTELHVVIPPTYGTEEPSPVGVECLEDVVASASTPEEERRAFAEHPAFESVCRILGEALRSHLQRSHLDAVTLTPEERYRELVARRPELLQRVPQYHLASLLGIQPETLSRIRRRIAVRARAGD